MNIDDGITHTEWVSKPKPFLTVKRVGGFFFAERLGKDSVAFILYDGSREKPWGLVNEYKNPIGKFLNTAFGGSMDHKGQSVKSLVIQEVSEESGYTVDSTRIHYLGKKFVSTQMNQWCLLFIVDVTGLNQGDKNPQSHEEEMAQTVWMTKEEILLGDDWKAVCIASLLYLVLKKLKKS